MSTNQHTPGPWKANTLPDLTLEILGKDALPVAVTCFYRNGTQQANAALIASAPDLLAALYASGIALRSCLRQNVQVDAAFEQVRAAIERATGSGFTDHRSPEELAASYPRSTTWTEGAK